MNQAPKSSRDCPGGTRQRFRRCTQTNTYPCVAACATSGMFFAQIRCSPDLALCASQPALPRASREREERACARVLQHDLAQHHDAHQAEPDGSIWALDCPDVSWLMLTRSPVSRTSGRQSIRASTERHARCWRLVTPSPPSIQSGLTKISLTSASGRGRSDSTAPCSRPSPSTRLVSSYALSHAYARTCKVRFRWACLPRAPVPRACWASPSRLR